MRLRALVGVLVILSLCIMAHAQKTQQFSADMNVTYSSRETFEMKLYVSGGNARIDIFQPADQRGTIISDPARHTTYLLKPPPQHIYEAREYAAPTMWESYLDWQHFDPANPCATLPITWKCEKLGMESIAGKVCDKWKVFGTTLHGKTPLVNILWIDKKNGIPIVQESDIGRVELTNIKEGSQSANLFVIPAEYQRVDEKRFDKGDSSQQPTQK